MEDECIKIINLTLEIYKDFGFENVKIKFSDRPKKELVMMKHGTFWRNLS